MTSTRSSGLDPARPADVPRQEAPERQASLVRVFATPEGESRFEAVELDQASRPGDHVYVLHRQPAVEARLLLAATDWTPRQPTASRRYMVFMQGSWTIETSDEETRTFAPGDVVLLEDVTGKGHRTRGQGLAMVVLLDTTRVAGP